MVVHYHYIVPETAAGPLQDKAVFLANLSFSSLGGLDSGDWVEPGVAAVGPESAGHGGYFPERTLARWLLSAGLPATVYAFERTGVAPLRAAYQALVRRLEADAVVGLRHRRLSRRVPRAGA